MENNIYIREKNYKSLKWYGYKIKHLERQGEEFLEIHWKKIPYPKDHKIYLLEFIQEVRMLQFVLGIAGITIFILCQIYSIRWVSLLGNILILVALLISKYLFSIQEVKYIENDFLEINPLIEEYKIKVK